MSNYHCRCNDKRCDGCGEGWLRELVEHVHGVSPFYHDIHTGLPIEPNTGELIALIHSELSEMLEGARTNKMDDYLPIRRAEEVEAADVLIRLLDYCGYRKLDLAGAFRDKLAYNRVRHDHTDEARREANGKKF